MCIRDSIKDDGCGIDKERMYYLKRLLNKNQNDTDTIGLYNIKKRIQLIYGDEYGIEVDSIEGEGTSVTIALPILRKDV